MWSEFKRQNWTPHVKPATPAGKAEQARLWEAFGKLPEVQKNLLSASAAARSHVVEEAGASLAAAYQADSAVGSKYGQKRARQEAMRRTLRQVRDAAEWRAGAAISAPWMGLRPELVDMSLSRAEVSRRCDQIFTYDGEPVPNPGACQN